MTALGINAVELLPVHEFYVEDFLTTKGLTNYWGYNSIAFFAPESSYAAGHVPGSQVAEFKTLVRELHKAGIKVILDVVYNHTGEGNEFGPTISLKGIDNPSYYFLSGPPDEPRRYYMNYRRRRDALNFDSPRVIRLAMDSLRYWCTRARRWLPLRSGVGAGLHCAGRLPHVGLVLRRHQPGSGAGKCASSFVAEQRDLASYELGNFRWTGRVERTLSRHDAGSSESDAIGSPTWAGG